MSRLRFCAALGVATALVFAPALARAGGVDLGKTYANHKTIHIQSADTWTVAATGTSTVITETLIVDGILSADGVGSAGKPGADGDGDGGGEAGKTGMAPGGGAGFFGKGGEGVDISDAGPCTADPNGGAGGKAFVTAESKLMNLLGSAGGGSTTMDPGGAGGGHLIIRATKIIVNGTISANGVTPGHEDGYAGGGSGGIVEIHAYELTGGGVIQAMGAPGAQSATVAGGGGSGGVVLLDLVKPWTGTPDVSGGDVMGCGNVGAGQAGTVIKTTPPKGCIDADGDGFYPKVCAPKGAEVDCDDSNANIFPGNVEACDGIDNNCNGKIDDDLPPDACAPNQVCEDGNCVTNHKPDAGGGDKDASAGPTPDRIDFAGGCDVMPIAKVSGFAATFAVLAGIALALRGGFGKKKRR